MAATGAARSPTRSAELPTAARRFGYTIAVIVNGVLLWAAHQLLSWEWPGFLTEDLEQVLGVVSASLVASMVANAVFVLRDRGVIRAFGDLVTAAFGLAAAVRLWQVFPFDFSGYATDWTWLVRTGLGAGIVATAIAGIVNLVELVGALARAADDRAMTTDETDEPAVAIERAADDFLSQTRIAVTGVSRDPADHGGNVVYRRLRDRGYDVFAVNPNADTVEGDPCWPDLASIPGGVDAVVIATRAESAEDTVRECVDLGISRVWMHRSFGPGSVSPVATDYGRSHGVTVIEGGCPLMFAPCDDGIHRVMRHVCTWAGTVPRDVPEPVGTAEPGAAPMATSATAGPGGAGSAGLRSGDG